MIKSDLYRELHARNIKIHEDSKLTNRELELILGTYEYKLKPEVQTKGMFKRLYDYQCPALCFSFDKLKPHEQSEVLSSGLYWGEIKQDGARCLIFYHPDIGFEFFGRDISDVDFLPSNFTDKILIIKNGKVTYPQSYVGVFKQSFVLDAEILFEGEYNTTTKTDDFTVTQLNATMSILGSSPERARAIQLEGNALKLYVFDILEYNDVDLKPLPFAQRRQRLEVLMKPLQQILPFKLNELRKEYLQDFFDEVIEAGGEGLVLKNIEKPYYTDGTRKRNVMLKMKRKLSGAKNQDIDAFISGSILPKKNSILDQKGLIGGVKVSIYLRDSFGCEKEHHIGTISGIPLALRKQMTIIGDNGKPELNPEYLGRVLTIEGQDISSVNKRISHCRASSWVFRTDKSTTDCVEDDYFIQSQIL